MIRPMQMVTAAVVTFSVFAPLPAHAASVWEANINLDNGQHLHWDVIYLSMDGVIHITGVVKIRNEVVGNIDGRIIGNKHLRLGYYSIFELVDKTQLDIDCVFSDNNHITGSVKGTDKLGNPVTGTITFNRI